MEFIFSMQINSKVSPSWHYLFWWKLPSTSKLPKIFYCSAKHSDILWGSSHVCCYLFSVYHIQPLITCFLWHGELRWLLPRFPLNFHPNAQAFPLDLKNNFVHKSLSSWENVDDILSKQKNWKKFWVLRTHTLFVSFCHIHPSFCYSPYKAKWWVPKLILNACTPR